ncbi:MAG: hypothetical protein RR280_01420 [Bacteroidaceae bacterium]
MSDTPIVTACVENLTALLEELNQVKKALFVYTQKELLDKTKNIPTLTTQVNVGVMYEAMIPKQQVQETKTTVISTEVSFIILVLAKPDTALGDKKAGVVAAMDVIRNQIKRKKSPTGHTWIFAGEQPVQEDDNMIIWAQRWTTANQV